MSADDQGGKYTVEPGALNDLFVWYYRTDDDQQPEPLVSQYAMQRQPGGAQLWDAIANLVETGGVAA